MFTKLQLNKIYHWLWKWYIPIKYSYITNNWAKFWSKLEDEKKNCNWWINYDLNLLLDSINLYISELNNKDEIIFFDFWAWLWNTVIPTIRQLIQKWYKVYYHAFDISEKIISLLKNNFKVNNIKINFNYTIIDFEEKDLSEIIFEVRKKYKNKPILWLFLWNTIWNFLSIERVLFNIMDALDLKDKLVIWIERVDLQNQRWLNSMLNWYKTKFSHDHDFATLKYLWFKQEYWNFDVIFNNINSSVETYFIFKKNFEIKLDWKKYKFNTWEKIKLFHSKKVNEEEFSKILIGLDLRICNLRTSKDNLHLQSLVENKKIY
jgi:hypothetical protein